MRVGRQVRHHDGAFLLGSARFRRCCLSGIFMMPFYYGSKARSVPEYLSLRFDEKTRGLNAMTFAVMTIFSSGISMYALGLLFQLVLGWSFTSSVMLSAVIVLIYTLLGGLTSAIYNEVLQFFLIVVGFAPLAILATRKAGGWAGMSARLPAVMTHSWSYMSNASQNPMGVDLFGMVGGAGVRALVWILVAWIFLSFSGPWRRISMSAARRTPVIAVAFPKMIMPFIVIVPGIAALALAKTNVGYVLPMKVKRLRLSDQALTTLMAAFYPARMLGVGLTALMASFMSGMAGNVTAFNTVFTYDIYQSYLHKGALLTRTIFNGRPDYHGCRHRAFHCDGLPGAALQQHHGSAAACFRLRERAAFRDIFTGNVLGAGRPGMAHFGLLSGTTAAALTPWTDHREEKGGWLGAVHTFPSQMAQNFWIAIFAWSSCFLVTILISVWRPSRRQDSGARKPGVWFDKDPARVDGVPWYKRPGPLAVVVAIICIALNFLFW